MSHANKKILLLLMLLALFLLLGGYLGTTYYYQNHFFPNTKISGIDCSGKDAEYLERINTQNGEDYLISIYDRKGNKYHLKGMDFDYTYVGTGEEKKLLEEQNAFTWPVEFSRNHDLSISTSYSYDENKLKEAILAMSFFSEEHEAPTDAFLKRNKDGSYSIEPEKQGDQPISSIVCDEIIQAVSEGMNSYTLSDACYETPAVLSDDEILSLELSQIKQYMNSTIHYEIGDADENLTAEMISEMLVFQDDHTVSIDETKVANYVQHLASTYNTYADVRKFKTSLGDKVKIGGGDYGWVINKTEEAKQLLEDLKGGTPVSREPIYEQTAKESGTNDIGSTYVELDYSNQHLYYYEEGRLKLESDFVSGNISKGNGSPDGIFKVVYKQSPATLVGEDYESKVKYFIPFAYNVGFHDASWRSKFGGEIYKKSGSHGCINVPKDTAQKLYEMLEVGTPVVAYYRERVKLSSESSKISNAYSYVEPKKKS